MPRPLAHPSTRSATALTALLTVAACGGSSSVTPTDTPDPTITASVNLTAQGTASTFDVGTWNLEWYGDTGRGPENEALQAALVKEIIEDADLDVWSVQEVTSVNAFNALLDELTGYEGLLANDPTVTNGPQFYNDFSGNEQKVGFIWKSSALTLNSARIILTENDFEFAGRPPLEVQATLTLGGASVPVVLVTLHAKAGAEQEDWERRSVAASAMKTYLDTTWPDATVFVMGDFNDDVDVSIYNSAVSPYAPFVDASDAWRFTTAILSDNDETSTVSFSDVIDHILVSNEGWADYQDGSVDVLSDIGALVSGANYGDDASDHYPVLARFTTGN